MHQQHGVLGDRQRAGLRFVDVGVVVDEPAAGRKRSKGCGEQLTDLLLAPVMQHVREQVQIVAARQWACEHVT